MIPRIRALLLAFVLPFTVVVHLCPHHFTAPVPLEGYSEGQSVTAQAPCHGSTHPSDSHGRTEDCSCDNHPADLASNFTKPVVTLPPVRPETRAVSWTLALAPAAARPPYWRPLSTAPPLA